MAGAVQVQREKSAGELLTHHRLEMRSARMDERRRDDHFAECECRLTHEPPERGPCKRNGSDHQERKRSAVQLTCVIPHARLAEFRRIDRQRQCQPGAQPWVLGCARSCRATCSLPETKTYRRPSE